VRFAFIAAEKAAVPVRLLCRTLQVSRAGVYAWQTRPPAARARADARLGLEIAAIHAESRQRYGRPRIHAELTDRGRGTGRKRVARLMRVRGLAARRRRRFRGTTQSRHPFPIAPNVLARQFERAAPDQAWVTDITYIPTGEGWLYLAVILDLCSRFAVGWAMSERITDDLTLEALGLALGRRRPPQGLLHHSDRGSQYASGDYQRLLAQHGIVCSMSRQGDCWDNAVAESFFATLAEGRAGPHRGLGHSGGGAHRALRVPRALLQWAAAAFGARVSQPPGLRATVGSRSIGSLTQVSTKSGQIQTDPARGYAPEQSPEPACRGKTSASPSQKRRSHDESDACGFVHGVRRAEARRGAKTSSG
jgi:putative transposase